MNPEHPKAKPAAEAPMPDGDALPAPPVITSEELLRGGKELVILHEGQEYHLRVTRQKKLILTK